MSYANLDDLIRAFGERELIDLTDRADPPAEAVDTAVVARALDDAQALIDGYLAGRYQTPLATVPDLVRRWACDIARFLLHAAGPTEAVRKAHDDTLRQLRDVADGRLQLPVSGPDAPKDVSGGVKAVHAPRVFDGAALRGFL